ncbi:MAG: SDR family oxidoreductase [Enterobacteriaceae bacterium]
MGARLKDKCAIVTGAAQGIGAAIATLFAGQGARVLLADKQYHKAEQLARTLSQSSGVTCLAMEVDVSQPDSVREMVATAITQFGRVDILINNAGINVFNDPLQLSSEEWHRCFSVDLEGVWHCCQAVLPSMLAQQYGHIVNIASVHGHKIIADAFPYPVVKHGLIGMTKALGIQYAAQGIRVNSISPGLIMTPIAQAYFDSCPDPQAEQQRQAEILPCKRIGTPEEVAYTALFLASDEAKFINASDILIDGGRSQVYCDAV